MPFISSVSGSRSGRLFGLGAKPAKIGSISLVAGDASDSFSWSAPNANGLSITKYGYQTSTNDGSTWSSETEVLTTEAVLNTQYNTNSFKIRVRAYNSAGWGDYSDISSVATVAWTSNTGTETETDTDTVCGPDGCSTTDTVTESYTDDCGANCYQSQYCECGAQYRFRTRSKSSSGTRTSSRTRTRTRSTQYYSRSGSTDSSVTYGSWSSYGPYTSYTYSAWSYGPYGDWTYSAYGSYNSCDATGTQEDKTYDTNYLFTTQYVANRGWYIYYSAWGWYWSDSAGNANITCAGGSGVEGPSVVYRCNRTGTWTTNAAGSDICIIPTCC